MKRKNKKLSAPVRLLENARRGSHKYTSLRPIYGLRGTLTIVGKHLIWLEKMFRMEKDLRFQENPVASKIPLKITPYSNELDLANWEGRREILNIRGAYGLYQFAERLERGDLLFCTYWNDAFVGFVWLELPPVIDAGYPLGANEVYTYDGWTFERYRGKRVLPVTQQAIFNYLREMHPDICTVVTHVATWNKPSLAGDQRAGYVIVGRERSMFFFGYHKKFGLRYIV